MAEKEQVKPLAAAAAGGYRIRSDVDDEAMSRELVKLHQRKYIKIGGCVTAFLSILAVIILILAFTVFNIKDPMIKMNGLTIQNLQLINGNSSNITVLVDVSVKNPNAATFRYSNSTATIYYRNVLVGEGRIPPGKAKARHTLRMNMTVDIIGAKFFAVPGWMNDFGSGALNMNSDTKISGRVKILNIIKKNVEVKMNCSVTYSISSQAIQDQKCNGRVHV